MNPLPISILLIVIFVGFKANLMAAAIIFVVILSIDYHMYLRGSKSNFFEDKTDLEKNLRKLQELEVKRKIKQLTNKEE